MGAPVIGTVNFNVTVRARQIGECWAALALETGLMTFAETRDEAESLNGAANVELIRLYKKMGEDALDVYLAGRGIPYRIDSGHVPSGEVPQLALAA